MVALASSRMDVELNCHLCRQHPETLRHLFFDCCMVQPLWNGSNCPYPTVDDDFVAWLTKWITHADYGLKMKCTAICWCIWKSRNALVWNNKAWNLHDINLEVQNLFTEWIDSLPQGGIVTDATLNIVEPVISDGTVCVYVDAAVFL